MTSWLQFALLALLSLTCTAYSSEYKITRLNKALAENPAVPIVFDSKTFAVATETPRNYSLFVVLTAEGKEFQCQPCQLFAQEVLLITQELHKRGPKNQVFFGVLDFAAGRDIFHKYKLTSVPFVYHFPPTEGPNKRVIKDEYEVYDLNRQGTKAEDFAFWVERHSGIKIAVRRPIDYQLYASYAFFGVTVLASLFMLQNQIIAFLSEKRLWQMMSLSMIVIFCSGYMWNQIRGAPFIGGNQGKPEFFAGGFQNQFVIESQIVGLLYGAISVFFVILYTQVPRIQNPAAQKTATFIVATLFVVTYSLLLKVFKFKNGGYPFALVSLAALIFPLFSVS
ncbi:oligosaccharyl transferase subunit ost3/OST6 [Chytriomyces hyalinus]|nr:oligosaccharyl transferase subunit ost3/OST6 [Chytriomyces hyalinus]